MSTLSKWLLVFLLILIVHSFYVTFAAIGLTGGVSTYIFPYGFRSVNFEALSRFLQVEFYLTLCVLIGFAISLFRAEEE